MDVVDSHPSCGQVCTLLIFVILCSGESGRASLLRLEIGTYVGAASFFSLVGKRGGGRVSSVFGRGQRAA